MRKLFLIIVMGMFGCASQIPYQPSAGNNLGTYGYTQKSVGNLERITFTGHITTEKRTIENYALYRCAEVAKQKKKPYFLLFNTLYEAIENKHTQQPRGWIVGTDSTVSVFLLLLDSPTEGALKTEQILLELKSIVNPTN